MSANVITLEFNELCPSLMDEYMKRGLLPNFARLYRESQVYVTDAEEKPPKLEPWIQWVTVHTGLSASEHGVFSLGDGAKLAAPCLWDMVSDAGHAVWVCGSMNVAMKRVNGYLLPDPWSTGVDPVPAGEFDAYFRFVRRYVQEHTRERIDFGARQRMEIARFLLGHGLSACTIRKTLAQLIGEAGGRGRWKRAAILDRLQWDLFRWYWKKSQPTYSTFFSNSTAHLQHMYWRNMDPTLFAVKPSAREQREYGDAVLFGYRQMDTIVGECLELAGDHATVIMCTALSQQGCFAYESSGGKKFYRMIDPARFLAFAGITAPYEYAPVMSEEFKLHFRTAEEAMAARDALLEMPVSGHRAMSARLEGRTLHAGCRIFAQLPAEAVLENAAGEPARFFDFFYQVEGTKSGMHHPDGMFWMRSPERSHRVHQAKLPLPQVAPKILAACGVPVPDWMMAGTPMTEAVPG